MESDDKKLDRLVRAVEALGERIESTSGRDAPDRESSYMMSTRDYRELLETRVRRGILGSVLRVSLVVLVLLALGIGIGSWIWLGRTVRREVDSLAKSLREKEIPQALRAQVGERLEAAVQEKSKEVTENFRKEVKEARWKLADRYLSTNSRLQQIQGLQIVRESDDRRAVDRILKFMREKGALEPLSLGLRKLNLDYGVQALLAQGSEEAQSAMRQVIADPGYASGVRADAIRAASTLKDRKALPALRAALGDSDREVRLGAVEAVVTLDARETWPYLVGMLAQGKDPRDYAAVVAALTKLNVNQAAEAVVGAVRRTTENPADLPSHQATHSAAITFFRTMKTEAAVPVLFDFLMHPNSEIRLQGVAAVRELTGTNLGTLEEWKTGDAEWRAGKVTEWRKLAALAKVKPVSGEAKESAAATDSETRRPIEKTPPEGPPAPPASSPGPAGPPSNSPERPPAGTPPEARSANP